MRARACVRACVRALLTAHVRACACCRYIDTMFRVQKGVISMKGGNTESFKTIDAFAVYGPAKVGEITFNISQNKS